MRTTTNKEIHNETTELSQHRSAGKQGVAGGPCIYLAGLQLDMYGKAYVFRPGQDLGGSGGVAGSAGTSPSITWPILSDFSFACSRR